MIPFIILREKLAHGRQKIDPLARARRGKASENDMLRRKALRFSYLLLAVSIVLTMNLIQVQYIQILRRKIQVSSKGVRQTWPPPSLFLSPSLSLPPNLPTIESNLGFKPSWGGTKESIIRPVTCWQRHELMRISNIQRMIFFLLEFFIDRSASGAFRREERFPLYIVWI